MRISDWSSDVCSSDLSPHDASIEPHPHPAISRAADRAIAEHRLVAFVEQVLDPAVKREALADRQLGAHARQHVTVEPGDIAGIVVAVANDANRATEAEREREAIIGREVHRLSRAAGEIVAEIGARGAVACPGIGVIRSEERRVGKEGGRTCRYRWL